MKRSFILANNHLFNHIGTIKFWAPFIIALSGVYGAAVPLAEMTAKYHTPVNGFMMGLIFSNPSYVYTTFILFLGFYLLINDLPLKDSQQNFLLIRSGKRAWIFSQIIYIFYVTLIYFSFIFAALFVFQLPRLGFDAENWGKIARSSTTPNTKMVIIATDSIREDYTPLEAFACSVGMAFLLALMVALVMLTLNLIFKNKTGTIIAGLLIFLVNIVHAKGFGSLPFYISPLGWCSLAIMDKNGTSRRPDFSYAITVISAAILACVIALIIYGNKKSKFTL